MKVAIVHDSPAMTGALGQVVRGVSGWSVAWTAVTGADAVDACAARRPDVLLGQLRLPDMNGAELTRRIAASAACPVVLLTDAADTASGLVFEAMAAGAVGVVPVPVIGADGRLAGTDEIVQRLRVASRLGGGRGEAAPVHRQVSSNPPLVALGASTGGPAALAVVLGALPVACRAAIVVVQHVGQDFSGELARWLDGRVRLPVRAAARGARPTPGTILLAGGEEDLLVTPAGAFDYRPPPPGSYYHPSVDVFFRSLAEHWALPGLAVLLTGIGRDGAEGLLALRQRGWRTIAQDEASSVVYGMPKAAVELKAAGQVLSLEHIGRAVAQFAAQAGPAEMMP